MRNALRIVTVAVVAAAVALGGAGAANAVIEYPAGGEWYHGVGSVRVFSDYYHASNTHRSSVQGKYYVNSGWKQPGVYTHAESAVRLSGNKAYWDIQY